MDALCTAKMVCLSDPTSASYASQLLDLTMQMGSALFHIRKYEEATEKFREAITLAERHRGRGSNLVASLLVNLGTVIVAGGDCHGAMPYFQRAAITFERLGQKKLLPMRIC